MKPEELRIGIFVNSPYDGGVIKVNAADIFLMANGHYKEARFEPIPLTEEWLLKFGFRKISNVRYSKAGFTPLITKGKNEYYATHVNYGVKSVHQLQNLYFVLTGKELTIKEEK